MSQHLTNPLALLVFCLALVAAGRARGQELFFTKQLEFLRADFGLAALAFGPALARAQKVRLRLVVCLPILVVLLAYGLRSQAQTPAEIAWLNQQAAPIGSVQAGTGFVDLAPLANVVGAARVVGLGECTHGSREVFQLKHRLLEYLVTQQGYTVFAIEADYTGAQRVNEYVQTGVGDSLKVLDALGYWTWYTQEVWELIKWMRAYNQTHPHALTFTGFDMNYPFFALQVSQQFARQQADSAAVAWVAELRATYRQGGRGSRAQRRRARYLSAQLAVALRRQQAPAELQQSVHTLAQYARMRSRIPAFGNQLRDRCMARNVEWLAQHYPTQKLVLWAHNAHVERRGGLSKSMGHYLGRTYGASYLPVGFATGQGTYTAIRVDSATRARHLTRDNVLLPPVPGSVEAWLAQARVPDFYLPLRGLPPHSPADGWLRQQVRTRNLGSTVPGRPAYQFTPNHRLAKEYDALIFLKQTSASRCLLVK